jgi:uncharacterized protein (DUF697 family)
MTENPTEAARAITEKCGYAAAALTLVPIPGTEVLAVMPIHVGMVVRIGEIYGVEMDRDTAQHLIMRIGATVGLSLVGSRVATTAAKFLLPGLGGLISAPFMYASTIAIGRVAELYFANNGMTDQEMKATYNEVLKKARKEFDPKRARSAEAKQQAEAAAKDTPATPDAGATPAPAATPGPAERLERLKALLDKGLIEQDEYDAAKAKVLSSI